MKILQINSVCGVGSTGRIATDLNRYLAAEGHSGAIAYGRGGAAGCDSVIRIGSQWDTYRHVFIARVFDRSGFGSRHATQQFIGQIKQFDPDIVHLHNLHGYYLHIGELFLFLRIR